MGIMIKYNKRIVKIIGILFLNLLLFAGLSSCEDYLDKAPLDKISDAAVWKDVALMNAYVIETYKQQRAPHSSNYYYSVCSDESFARERTDAFLVQQGNMTPSDLGRMGNDWPTYYKNVTRGNIFLSNIENIDLSGFTAADKDKVSVLIGEMKFHRAFAYFRLGSLFGGVPLVTEPFKLDDDFNIPRDSYDDVMNFVVAELTEAADLLPLSRSSNDRGRVTKGAALGLKSRALLYMASPLNNPGNVQSKWQAAAAAAKEVIDLGLYSLYPDYGELFREEANFNDEVIWERVIENDYVRTMGIERDFYPNGFGGYAVTVPTQRQVDAYETLNGLSVVDDPAYDPNEFWLNRDPRFYATILYDGAPFRGRQIETFMPDGMDSFGGPTASWNASYTGYYSRKFIQEFLPGSPGGSSGNTSSPNWPYLRYAEILLNYAEANYNLGLEDIAREYINKVRSRPSVNMPAVTDTGADLMVRIKRERQVELYLEEHRFFDTRRWKEVYPPDDYIQKMNVDKDPVTGVKTYYLTNVLSFALPERTFHLPIPLVEITRDPNLEQNPGY
ncbi:MAG TPA: RagB/SusD family nutrient uptake outer membrane protein [Bacteroidales bacterium]|nr:RagB/SusD family nutrient uptake outer membrane protein [Bacteroidales bacterium]